MISARSLTEAFFKEFDRKRTSGSPRILTVHSDDYLTRAVNFYITNRAEAAQRNVGAREDMRQVYVSAELKNLGKVVQGGLLYRSPTDCLKPMKIVLEARPPDCDEKIGYIQVSVEKAEKLTNMLKSEHWKPGWLWQLAYAEECAEGYQIYPGDSKVVKCIMSYYRKHPPIYTPSKVEGDYLNLDGQRISKDQGLILDNRNQAEWIVKIAVMMAQKDSGALQEMQAKLIEMNFLETFKI